MMKISIIFLLFIIQNVFSAVHWGIQQQNWPFPMPKNGQPNSNQLKQISLQPNENSQSQQPSTPWNDYNEYLAKLTDYYNDYYSEYGSRYNEYLAKFSEWLKTSFGGSSNVGGPSPPPMPISPAEIGQSGTMPPGANGMNGPALPNTSRIPFHRHRPVCPPKMFPPANKTANGSKNEPKFVHPLVLPIIHGNFTAKVNAGATSNLSIVDPFQQHLAMHSSVTVVVDHDQEGNKHIIVVDTGLAVLKHAILNGLLANGIQAHQVDTVCITHPDTDTMGNLNLFPCAEIHSGNAISRENLFARQSAPQFESNRSDLPFRRLFVHSELFLTPGLSFQDQSLVIRNVADHGTVAIVGKLILNEGDLTNNLAIREFATEDSEHRKLWQATRREIVCMADYIVPGYGIPFKVSSEMKSLAECGMAKKKSSMPPFSTWGKKMA